MRWGEGVGVGSGLRHRSTKLPKGLGHLLRVSLCAFFFAVGSDGSSGRKPTKERRGEKHGRRRLMGLDAHQAEEREGAGWGWRAARCEQTASNSKRGSVRSSSRRAAPAELRARRDFQWRPSHGALDPCNCMFERQQSGAESTPLPHQ